MFATTKDGKKVRSGVEVYCPVWVLLQCTPGEFPNKRKPLYSKRDRSKNERMRPKKFHLIIAAGNCVVDDSWRGNGYIGAGLSGVSTSSIASKLRVPMSSCYEDYSVLNDLVCNPSFMGEIGKPHIVLGEIMEPDLQHSTKYLLQVDRSQGF